MERFLDVGADSVWVSDPGGAGTPVVLVHPGWGDASIWDGVLARLPTSIRPIRYDNRGYGRSPAPTQPFSWHDDLVAVTDGLADAVIVGHSGGGAAAIGLALSCPERVGSLLLVTPVPGLSTTSSPGSTPCSPPTTGTG
ncbi:Alpha/beta hydrolase family protein [Asanoa hainanensis]|uniref:Alpha/beta hydrolase family protein n=1 Tax=Asanoa hainanensis TaxID=560556 RepID=A0A239NDB3_9ACTN|nr:alpha/beta hydrolase [Asanoa hainanensis]SNT52957.1 Alpha/beta hydrolase family protein [Asanoa hainanensis]